MIGPTHVRWCAKINSVGQFRHCRVMFPGNMASRDPCSRGTWCKPRDTMHLRQLFGLTTVLSRSIRILCCCVMNDVTNVLHLFSDITKQILTVSLDQHWKIMSLSCATLPEGQTRQYLYIEALWQNDPWQHILLVVGVSSRSHSEHGLAHLHGVSKMSATSTRCLKNHPQIYFWISLSQVNRLE